MRGSANVLLPMPIAGFGSSDCTTCRSHLLQWPNGTALLLPTLISCGRPQGLICTFEP